MTLTAAVVLLLGAIGAGPVQWAGAHAGSEARRAGAAPDAVVTITRASGRAVPRSFLGLATEYDSIPIYQRQPVLMGRVLSLLRPADGSPLVLRVGGLSADDSLWAPALVTALPAKALALTPADLTGIAALVRSQHLRVILDLNLAADMPRAEAELAGAAERALPRGSIESFEIGNEPDYYRFALRGNPAYYPSSYTPSLYTERFLQYASALARTAPGVPLAGPALANPVGDFSYLTDLATGARGSVGTLTVHRYALSACASPRSRLYPTITRLLRPSASVGLARSLTASVALAHGQHLSIRWDELNSVTCGGTVGVSDSFASALWATDTLFAGLGVGIDGVNVQMRPTALNAPFYLTATGVQARPLLYALVLFKDAVGPGGRLADAQLAGPAASLSAWAVRSPRGRLSVVLINKGTARRTVMVRGAAGARSAIVSRLLGSSIRTESQVTFAGRRIDGAGRWAGRSQVQVVARTAGGYRITLPAFSAALVSVGG
jgi:hypothetical protein